MGTNSNIWLSHTLQFVLVRRKTKVPNTKRWQQYWQKYGTLMQYANLRHQIMDIWGCIIKGGDTGKDSYQNHIFSFLFFQCLIPWDRILRMETLFQSIFASEGIYNSYNNNNNNNKVCIGVVRKRKGQKCTRRRHLYPQLDLNIPRQEVEITNSNLLQRQTSNR